MRRVVGDPQTATLKVAFETPDRQSVYSHEPNYVDANSKNCILSASIPVRGGQIHGLESSQIFFFLKAVSFLVCQVFGSTRRRVLPGVFLPLSPL